MTSVATQLINAAPFHRLSSSISPSQSSSAPQPKGTLDPLGRAIRTEVPERIPSTSTRRKNSFLISLDLFSFKATPKGEWCELMHGSGRSHKPSLQQQCKEKETAQELAPNEHCDELITREFLGPTETPHRRRSSRLSSIGEKIKSFLPATLRKDSGIDSSFEPIEPFDTCISDITCPQIPSLQNDPHAMSELFHNCAAMEPLAQHGFLRFAACSTDNLQSFDGPSDYWRAKTYQNRRCTNIRKDTSFEQAPRQSLDFPPTQLTPETNSKTIVRGDPHRWSTLRDYSPPVARSEQAPSQSNRLFRLRFGSFGILRRRKGKDRGKSAVRHSQYEPLSMASSNLSITNTTVPSNPSPNLRPYDPISGIGVLPISEASSVSNSHDIPQPVYISKSLSSSLVPLIGLPTEDNDNSSHSPILSQENIRSCSTSTLGHGSLSAVSPLCGPVLEPPIQEPLELPSMSVHAPSPLPFLDSTASESSHGHFTGQLPDELPAANSSCTSTHTNISHPTDDTYDTQHAAPDEHGLFRRFATPMGM